MLCSPSLETGIGHKLALFYSSWALILEIKKRMYSEAYAKIEEGINKQAEPVEQLQFALKQVSPDCSQLL